ncbi:YbaB/EbfC family nucleoid-associated protein [Mycolicibacterium arabiense]|nr:YbaB/EbfC family nucleoid-associated protein [Mycolicibacterium arabiense]MCV7376914.1 YbaB/EbfC family nucleoid-associated protein [Mycolicibacterium arabiense]
MDNDALRHDVTEITAMVEDQMREIAAVQAKRAALSATGTSADGLVEVTVDAQRAVTDTVIDERYLEEFEFEDLAQHVTKAARAAVERVDAQTAELIAPLSERRESTSFTAGINAVPEFADIFAKARQAMSAHPPTSAQPGDRDFGEDSRFPTVRE